jgi:molybdopterin biosynthesis enzyme
MSDANGILLIPEGVSTYREGEVVVIQMLS